MEYLFVNSGLPIIKHVSDLRLNLYLFRMKHPFGVDKVYFFWINYENMVLNVFISRPPKNLQASIFERCDDDINRKHDFYGQLAKIGLIPFQH